MAETPKEAQARIISDFETMKSLELSARDLYAQIAADPEIQVQKVKTAFSSLAADEQEHAEIVQEIINIVTNAL